MNIKVGINLIENNSNRIGVIAPIGSGLSLLLKSVVESKKAEGIRILSYGLDEQLIDELDGVEILAETSYEPKLKPKNNQKILIITNNKKIMIVNRDVPGYDFLFVSRDGDEVLKLTSDYIELPHSNEVTSKKALDPLAIGTVRYKDTIIKL